MAKIVEMNKDIRNYKEKLLGPFSGREIICLALGLATAYFIKSSFFPEMEATDENMGFIVIGSMLPFGVIGWVKIYGMYIEQFIKTALTTTIAPKKRFYDNGNTPKKKIIKTKKSKQKDLKRFL